MQLTDRERAMLAGDEGSARARAMDQLVRYGEALGAERMVEVTNVAGTWSSTTPFVQAGLVRPTDFDAIFSRFNLDSDETVETPQAVASTCQLIHGLDTRNYRMQGFSHEQADLQMASEDFFGRRGVQWMSTCTPYQMDNVPVKGGARGVDGELGRGLRDLRSRRPHEHRGARVDRGCLDHGSGTVFRAARSRTATQRVRIEIPVETMMNWGLMG